MQARASSVLSLPEEEVENSPGWSPPGRTELWERVRKMPAPSRRVGRNSSPHVTRVVFNVVSLQKRDELALEIMFPMVLFLARNVRKRGVYLSPSDGERPIPFLPFETFLTARFVHPA